MTESNEFDTILRPPWVNLARGAWLVLSAIAIVSSIVSALIAANQVLPSCALANVSCGPWSVTQEDAALARQLGLSDQFLRAILFLIGFVSRLGFVVVGSVIFWRKSKDWVALLLSLLLMLWTVEGVYNLGAFMPVVTALYALDIAVFAVIPFIFPSGRFVPRWTRWAVLASLLVGVPTAFLPGMGLSDRLFALFLLGPWLLWFVVAGYAATYRYRRVSNARERQQTKWVLVGMLSSIILFIPFGIIATAFPPSQPSLGRLIFVLVVLMPISAASYLLISGGVGFAILRYRLWDIDIIIRRTLVYGMLSVMLALVYLGSVILLQQLFHFITGAVQSEIVTIISTLAIAALFNPLRLRVQQVIDHRFYRRKYNAQQVLAQFAATARDEVELSRLTDELLNVVSDTMQPANASLWLKSPEVRPVQLGREP